MFLLGFLLLSAYFSLSEAPLRKKLQFFVSDYFNEIKPRPDPDTVLILDIDDESLGHLGQWPWPRPILARIIKNLTDSGAMVIAFDGVLAEPDRTSPANLIPLLEGHAVADDVRETLLSLPDYDQLLANSIKESGIFVSGFSHGNYGQERPVIKSSIKITKDAKESFTKYSRSFSHTARFIPVLEKASAGNGSFMANPEVDGIIRSTGLIFSDGKTLYPSLSLEALRVSLRGSFYVLREKPKEELKFFDTNYELCLIQQIKKSEGQECSYSRVPLDNNALFLVHFRKFDRKQDYLPAYHMAGETVAEDIKKKVDGKIILVGSSAEGLKDLRSSPLELFIPGVEVHANVIEQIIQGDYLTRTLITKRFELFGIIALGLLMIILAPKLNALRMTGLCIVIIGVLFYGGWYAYDVHGMVFDPVYPGLTILILFIASTLLAFSRTEADRRRVKNAFGHYISPEFMEELTKNPDKLVLGGETRDLTIMFTDIRNFTGISERLSPAALTQLMNDFLTPMSDLVMQNRGTIDKFMGDAMMAFWNAPLDDADHARHACLTALQMNDALRPINEKLKEEAAAAGQEPVLLQAGIGLNTGTASVGNMGSRQRFAYSALGDNVNLASRLESQTKSYGVEILIGPATEKLVPDLATLELDLLRVKGKNEPVHVFTLIGDEKVARSEEFKLWKAAQSQMLSQYRAMDFDAAENTLADCRILSNGRLSVYYDMYMQRISALKTSRPSQDWDGVFVATTK